MPKTDARLASKVIEEITSGYKGEFDLDSVILWAKDFHWPPFSTFRASVDPTAPPRISGDYPDVVVLDLLNRSETGRNWKETISTTTCGNGRGQRGPGLLSSSYGASIKAAGRRSGLSRTLKKMTND